MRQALERKKAAQQGGTAGVPMDRERGQAHGQMGGRREFRRKSGG